MTTTDNKTKTTETTLAKSHTVSGKKLLEMKISTLPYLVDGLIPLSGVVALAGSSDTGKSSFLRQLAVSIVRRQSTFLDFHLRTTYGSVMYVSTEDDETAMAYLLGKQNAEQNPSSEYEGLRFLFDTDDVIKKLKEELTKSPVDCIMVDTFTDLYGGEMNASNKVRSFINEYSNIAKQFNCLVLFLHHTGKRTDQLAPSKDNLLGSQGFEAKMRLVMELRKDTSDPNLRHLCVVKGNYIPSCDKDRSFVLKFDDNMLYSNTGDRRFFHQLVKKDEKVSRTELEEKVLDCKSKGLSIRATVNTLRTEGIRVSKTTVSDIRDGSGENHPVTDVIHHDFNLDDEEEYYVPFPEKVV